MPTKPHPKPHEIGQLLYEEGEVLEALDELESRGFTPAAPSRMAHSSDGSRKSTLDDLDEFASRQDSIFWKGCKKLRRLLSLG